MKAYILLVLLSLVSGGCASNPIKSSDSAGSWFSKEGAFPEDRTSRRLLIAEWRSEATDIHGVRRIELATRNADGTYVVRFTEVSESGKVTSDRMECGKWGISGDIYFTITLSMREGENGQATSPYDASLYDAYRIQKLTDTTFEYRHVVQGALERETRVGPPPSRDRMREGIPVSVCEGKAI
jgi:hypothetical protein